MSRGGAAVARKNDHWNGLFKLLRTFTRHNGQGGNCRWLGAVCLHQSFETIGNKVSESKVERKVCNRKAITVKITVLCINLRDGGATPVAS